MALELRQQLKLTQQLVMTPQLQMAIKLLQLSRLELVEAIRQELEENPVLEEVQEDHDSQREKALDSNETSDDTSGRDEKIQEVNIEEKVPDDIDWSRYLEDYNSPGKTTFENEGKEAPKYEAFISKKESLSEHLLWQLMMASPTPEEQRIASLIIGNLNKNGFLDVPIENLAEMAECQPDDVFQVLQILQSFDPVGICARDLAECLLIQLRHYGWENRIVTRIVEHHLNHLENKNYKAIARALKVNLNKVVEAVNLIKRLEPRPGRLFSDDNCQYIQPDIYVYKIEDDFVIFLNDDGLPKIQISAFYQNAINNRSDVSGSAKEYMQEKMRSASWLIKSIQQRQKTIFRVMESILKFQREFFEKGIAYLKPMILKDVAEDIEMHESTISRVTTNKYAYTPQGIFELKYFFNSSINRVHGEAIAAAAVQDAIRRIVENENPKKPYSDDKISQLLKESNIDIARRTVAKYREMMNILPSNKRKQF